MFGFQAGLVTSRSDAFLHFAPSEARRTGVCRGECTEYVQQFLEQNGSYVRFFKYVNVPDEIFFHTVVLNSPLKEFVVSNDLRFLEWRNAAIAGGPTVLRKYDLKKIHSPKLFARKFDITQDAEILDMIDAETHDE